MKPIRKQHTTRILGAPKGWDAATQGECSELPITDSDGHMFSYWQPSWKDRVRILFGRTIRLVVIGYSHPPVALDTE